MRGEGGLFLLPSILFFSPSSPYCFSPLTSSSPDFLSICLPLGGPGGRGGTYPPVPPALLPVWTRVFIQEMPMDALEVIFHLVPDSAFLRRLLLQQPSRRVCQREGLSDLSPQPHVFLGWP